MPSVEQTPEARESIKEIGRYIAKESGRFEVAREFLQKIEAKCEQYARQPLMGEARPELGEGLRHFPVDSYVVIYEPLVDGIRVLLVIHGARDIPAVFRRVFGTA